VIPLIVSVIRPASFENSELPDAIGVKRSDTLGIRPNSPIKLPRRLDHRQRV
jgi:hypothetical protein